VNNATVEVILQRLKEAGLKVNAEKSAFGITELDFLGYWLTPNGIDVNSVKLRFSLQYYFLK